MILGWQVDEARGSGVLQLHCQMAPKPIVARRLPRVGWTITDVFPSRWVLDADGAALHVKTVLESNRGFSSD
ncbi:MAG: hypothetical protein OEY98_07475 [Acidimicrobiia bacterium]|nr:hypothetical protein [Acidimicrobiia bacterium]